MIRTLVQNSLRCIPPIVIVLIVVEIIMTNQLVGSGREVSSLDAKVESLKQENEMLRENVASASSLLTISEKSVHMGFVDKTHAHYLTVGSEQLPVALNHPQ